MKKLLFQLDTDPRASAFDAVLAYDAGVDHLLQVPGIDARSCAPVVEGAIFTRPPKHKKHTALFVGGSDLGAGESVLSAVRGIFFDRFRVSVMLDSNGGNTTAAAAVALLEGATRLAGQRAAVLAGTGPVGSRAAALLGLAGAEVALCSRRLDRAERACRALHERFGVRATACETTDAGSTARALDGAAIVVAAGKSGVRLLERAQWEGSGSIEALADLATTPPGGVEGIEMTDKAVERAGKIVFGGIGIGALKLRVQRACVAQLFESNDQVLDAEAIFARARELAAS